MNEKNEPNMFLRQEEALALFKEVVGDKKTEDLVAAALTTLWQTSQRSRPRKDFDLHFFTEVLIAFCSKHELLRSILDGTYEGWPE